MKIHYMNILAQRVGSICIVILLTVGCDDFVRIDPPQTDLAKSTIFSSDETAESAVLDMYYQLSAGGFANGGNQSISFLLSLSSDEQISYVTGLAQTVAYYKQFNDNALLPNNVYVSRFWTQCYQLIYKANSVMQGITSSTGMSEEMKAQLRGEALFIRSFCNFYLVNLFGPVPLVTVTDYHVNAGVGRAAEEDVYKQIIADLKEAQEILKDDYSFSSDERVRVNKGAATALLARAYLYNGDWTNAAIQSGLLIADVDRYALEPDLTQIFRVGSKEPIFQLWRNFSTNDRSTFTNTRNGALRTEFLAAFEESDQRKATWIYPQVVRGVTYQTTLKYQSIAFDPPDEYTTLFRMAEQFLIRAEARAQLDDVSGAQEDVNAIRYRAGLGDTPANDKTTLLVAIEQERRVELFNEWGHRWFDLKRTNRADAVLEILKPQWKSSAVLMPLPETELRNNPALSDAQNPGY